MSTFNIYLVGFILFTIGLALGAYLLNVPPIWIGVGAIVMIGLGILTGVGKTRTKDVSTEG